VGYTTDVVSWLLLYEISLISICSAFSLEGRAYRRSFAFNIMLVLSFFSTACLFVTLSSSVTTASLSSSTSLASFVLLGLLIVALVKTPAYPFSVWLPEAHVEGSVYGSIALAAFAMKFSLALILLFLLASYSSSSDTAFASWLVVLGAFVGAFSVAAYSDFKKISAAISILHMCLALLLLYNVTAVDIDYSLFAWHHHSVIASLNFLYRSSLCNFRITNYTLW